MELLRAREVLSAACALAAIGALGAAPLALAAGTEPRILSVEPLRVGELLACRVATANLPGETLATSMQSGLPSAVEIVLDVLDTKDRVVAGNRVTFRLAFDLWEETFRVEGAGEERDFTTRGELETYLAAPPRLPVAPISGLAPDARVRLRVGVLLHALAPRESDRLASWVSGEASADSRPNPVANEDGREVVVSLGKIIRYFFDEARGEEAVSAVATSGWFTPKDLQ